MNDEYLTPEKTSKLLKVTTCTLQKWSNKGKIACFRTEGNHRRYRLSDIKKIMSTGGEGKEVEGRKICYCRVSTPSQKEDLERQVEYFQAEFPNHEIIKDTGSGLNFKRKGFNAILDSAIRGDISEVVVTHKDRLCRFGFELIERVIASGNGKILVLNQEKTSPEKELVDDLLSIITVFSARLYGLRSHQLKRKIKESAENSEVPSSTV